MSVPMDPENDGEEEVDVRGTVLELLMNAARVLIDDANKLKFVERCIGYVLGERFEEELTSLIVGRRLPAEALLIESLRRLVDEDPRVLSIVQIAVEIALGLPSTVATILLPAVLPCQARDAATVSKLASFGASMLIAINLPSMIETAESKDIDAVRSVLDEVSRMEDHRRLALLVGIAVLVGGKIVERCRGTMVPPDISVLAALMRRIDALREIVEEMERIGLIETKSEMQRRIRRVREVDMYRHYQLFGG